MRLECESLATYRVLLLSPSAARRNSRVVGRAPLEPSGAPTLAMDVASGKEVKTDARQEHAVDPLAIDVMASPERVRTFLADISKIEKWTAHRAVRRAGGAWAELRAVGASGALAGVVQVSSLMWLRTAMNYQYANGGNGTLATVATLYEEGGLPRLYRGVQYALVQNPLSRFGDAAANAAVPALVVALVPGIPLPASQAVASATAAGWRILIAPVDALKTALQVDGSATALTDRISTVGPGVLWRGSLAAAAATFVGNYPWFLTYNSLDQSLPPELYDGPASALVRRALLGVCASCVSDVCSNAIRVVKTKVQTSPDEDTNPLQAARAILEEDGVEGLFFRGLETRLTINCLQGAVFSVAWKYFEKALAG